MKKTRHTKNGGYIMKGIRFSKNRFGEVEANSITECLKQKGIFPRGVILTSDEIYDICKNRGYTNHKSRVKSALYQGELMGRVVNLGGGKGYIFLN